MTFRHIILSAILGLGACAVSCSNAAKDSQNGSENPATSVEAPAKAAPVTAITPDKTLPTVIDFNATWCGPCQRFAPIFEETANEYRGKAIFISVDVDNSPELARLFEVSAIPQVTILLPDGSVKSNVGFMEKSQFIDFFTPYLPK